MAEIKTNFSGYVTLDNVDYICVVEDHFVKLMPNDRKKSHFYPKPQEGNFFIYGFDESNYRIALNAKQLQTGMFGGPVHFTAPLIIRGDTNTGNPTSYSDLTSYDTIEFSGGTINKVFVPKSAIDIEAAFNSMEQSFESGERTITIKPYNAYTESYEVNIKGQKAIVEYSIRHHTKHTDLKTDDLGKLESFIRIVFEQPQPIESLEEYYRIIVYLLTFLVGQHNVEFKVALRKKIKEGPQAGLLAKVADCKIYHRNKDYFKRDHTQVIPLGIFKDKLQSALKIFSELEFNLQFLPKNNSERTYINCDRIRDLCAALEAEYDNKKYKLQKDEIVEKLKKNTKELIEAFKEEYPELSDKTYERAKSSLQYWSIPASEKISQLHHRYEAQIDSCLSILKDWNIVIDLNDDSIAKFVKLRNDISHSWITALSKEYINIFSLLEVLVYLSIFERIGFKPTDVIEYIQRVLI